MTGIIYLAVSKTTDPTSGWWTFPINSTQACIPDQPTLGVSDDKIAVSVNGCLGVQYWIFNKSDLLAGQNVYSTSILGFDVYAVHPAQALSSTTTLYMITTYDGYPDSARLFRVTGVPPGPITIYATDLSLSPMTSPPKAPQLGSFYRLDTGDNRVLDAKWDRGMLWISLNDGCIPTADNQTRSCVRLIQIDTRTLHVAQDFDIGAPGQYYYYPAVSPDRRGNLLVVFGEASLTSYPSMMVSAQTAVDRDSLGQPVIVAAGSAPDLSSCTVDRGCRYGDYFEANRRLHLSAIPYLGDRSSCPFHPQVNAVIGSKKNKELNPAPSACDVITDFSILSQELLIRSCENLKTEI